jgi:hypothetical protein
MYDANDGLFVHISLVLEMYQAFVENYYLLID